MSFLPFTVSVPASTSNLGSGFDTVSAALQLPLVCRVAAANIDGIGWLGVPVEPARNIARQALKVGCSYLGVEANGVEIKMDNPIPLARGLGSSGAAIAAGLAIAQRFAGVDLSVQEVLRLGCPLEGHPDNLAASLLGGWVLSRTDENGSVAAERIESGIECRFVLAVPEIHVSTEQARELLPATYDRADVIFTQQRCALLVHAISANRPELLAEATRDRIHQPYRAELIPGSDRLLDRGRWPDELSDSLLAVTISGSGSALVAMTRGHEEETAAWMLEELALSGTAASSMVLEIDREGVQIWDDGE